MITAIYSPSSTPVQIISLTPANRRRGQFAHVVTRSGLREFKSYSNLDGDTAMSDTAFIPLGLLKDIRSNGLTANEAALVARAAGA